ncbi:hypothetical protein [Schlesneria sp. T3-172]|uniref:hypothetical protein n=1 Tax=Schlesneria sphaerica TaxID=3373610 RepID=UPI0037C665AE
MKRLFCLLNLLAMPLWASDAPDEAAYTVYLGENGVLVLKLIIEVEGSTPRGAFEHYIDHLMKSLDSNGDGTITTEEANGKYLTDNDARQAQLTPSSETVARNLVPDTSPADGKISRQEFLAYYRRIGLNPFVAFFQPNAEPQNGNRQPRRGTSTSETSLFLQLDTNRDGKLSADELTGALQTLRKLDLDHDETISAAELNPLTDTVVNQQRLPQTQDRMGSTSPFLGAGFDESLQKQVRRLIEKYDTTDPLKSGLPGSRVRNQKLSPQEIGLSQTAFTRYDGDGDGQLDFDELRQFLTHPEPTIIITFNLGEDSPLSTHTVTDELQDKVKISPDGSANINLGSTQLCLVKNNVSRVPSADQFLKPQFMAADADANGYLEKSEADRAFFFGATFQDLDADKNEKLFLEEVVAYFQLRFGVARSRVVLNINEQGRTLFEILDTDRDRRLSFRELKSAAEKLALWDKDGDGLLSDSEVPLQYRLIVAQGTLPALEGNVDRGNQTGTLAERATGPLWFRKMDKNRDGEVSQREFLGDLSLFEQFDQNKDQYIDVTEALSAPVESLK